MIHLRRVSLLRRLMESSSRRRRFTTGETSSVYSENIPPTLDEVLAEQPRFKGAYMIAGALAGVAACAYYYFDYRLGSERFNATIQALGSGSPMTVVDGLKRLDDILYQDVRTFSGTNTIFNGHTELIKLGLVEALLQALARDGVDWTSRFQILELLAILASESAPARQRLCNSDLTPLARVITTADADHARAAMLAGSTLLAVVRDVDCRQAVRDSESVPVVIDAIKALPVAHTSDAALLTLLANELIVETKPASANDVVAATSSLHGVSSKSLNAGVRALLHASTASVERSTSQSVLLHGAAAAALAHVYGRARWLVHAWRGETGLPLAELARGAARRNRVAHWLVAMLVFDAGCALLARRWSDVRSDVVAFGRDADRLSGLQPIVDAPAARLVLPSLGALGVTTLGLVAFQRQRFVVVPIVASLTIAHWDFVRGTTLYKRLCSTSSISTTPLVPITPPPPPPPSSSTPVIPPSPSTSEKKL